MNFNATTYERRQIKKVQNLINEGKHRQAFDLGCNFRSANKRRAEARRFQLSHFVRQWNHIFSMGLNDQL